MCTRDQEYMYQYIVIFRVGPRGILTTGVWGHRPQGARRGSARVSGLLYSSPVAMGGRHAIAAFNLA